MDVGILKQVKYGYTAGRINNLWNELTFMDSTLRNSVRLTWLSVQKEKATLCRFFFV